ncbi:hypothetical protein [Amycolatopsis sp. FDAARGOS 1241]|nr:hypothetical protein [Amycolatopsis sp. FDAARGOS 1241]
MSGRPDPKPAGNPWDLHESITRDNEELTRARRDADTKGGRR